MSFVKKIIFTFYTLVKNIFQFSFFISSILLFTSYYSTFIHPSSFILLPFISLLFPIFLLVHFFWIIFFAVSFKIRHLVIALLILIFFFPQIKEYYNISFAEKSNDLSNTISVMSFNVKLFDLYNWQNSYQTREKIFEYVKNNPADIMCFQEFYTSEDSGDFNNYNDLKKLFPHYYFHTAYFITLRGNDHWGLLTMSKYPIINPSVVHFNNAKNNGCIYSDIVFNKDTIRVFNIHLQSYSLFKKKKWKFNQKPDNENFFQALDKTAKGASLIEKIYYNNQLKTQQAETILHIAQPSHYPTLLVGDFNDISNSYLMQQLKKNDYKDAFIEKGNGFGITYHDKIYLRIDYIFHNSAFQTLDFSTENNPQTQNISDHYPIKCILGLKK